jgi:SAM-dependent methyltransferase
MLAFYCAVARQCFIAEYAFLFDEEELARVNVLKDSLVAALRADARIEPIQLAAVAAYLPLQSLEEDERLLARTWPAPIDALLTQQIREPAEERGRRATIPAITPIEDRVSIAVRNQYEEHPYPRWVEAPTLEQPVSIAKHMRGLFPLVAFRAPPPNSAVDLMIAGCGTGQSVINYARRFADARVLAVDLSLTSLSYAKRKIAALGLPQVEFAQADILKLGSLDRRFDVINCSGVLHHLGDPMSGWRTLLSLLKPDGLMSVALYSELARTDYVAAQKMIAERGYGRTASEIRRFRRDLIAGEKSKTYFGVLGCADFFTISACRDLLFHAQEHRMTIPQLKAFFEEKALNFLGFEIEQAVKQHYAARFPGDRTLTDLDNWHVYEQENPYTFLRMYQFWVQARG